MFRSSQAQSLAPSTDLAAPLVPNTGWYDLVINRRYELIENCEATLIQLQRVLAQWHDHIPGITSFLHAMSQKLEILKQDHPGRDIELGPWSVFFTQLQHCIAELSAFSIIASDKKNRTPQIIAAGIERVKMWPALIKAFNNLELDLIVGGLFASSAATIDSAKQQAANLSLTSVLPPYQIEQLQDCSHWLDTNLGAAFSSYPEMMQDAILITASGFNMLFRHVYLGLDKVACQTGFDQKKLAHEPLFTSKGKASPSIGNSEEKSVAPLTLSFHQLALKFRDLYSACMTQAGYLKHEEYYPFHRATLVQRRAFPAALAQQFDTEKQNQKQRWEKAKQECLDIIQVKIRQLEDETGYFTRTYHRIEALKALAEAWPDTAQGVDFDVLPHIRHIAEKDVVDKIHAVYVNLIDRNRNRIGWFKQQEKNIQELIEQAEADIKIVSSEKSDNETVVAATQARTLNELVTTSAPALIGHTRQLISILTNTGAAQSEETIFDNVLSVVTQCEIKLKEMLDETVYNAWFEGDRLVNVKFNLLLDVVDHEEKYVDSIEPRPTRDIFDVKIEMNTAWMNHLAQLIKQVKKVAQEGKAMLAKSAVGHRSHTMPAVQFQKTLQQTDVSVLSITSLIQALNDLRKNPIVSALPPIGAMLSAAIPTIQSQFSQTIVNPLSNHPLQHAWFGRADHASPEDKLKGGLQNIRQIYLGLLDQSEKDEAIKAMAVHGLKKADELLEEFQRETSAMTFVFKRPKSIFKFVKRLSDLFTTLFTLSGDQLLTAAEQINDAIRNLFLLFDKLELQFYMREQYIANLISVNGQTLSELAKTFTDLVKDQGYQFAPEKRFPYKIAMLAQRKELLRSYPHDASTKEFLQQRVQQAEGAVAAIESAAVAEQDTQQADLKRVILQTLKSRAEELTAENESSCRFSACKEKKENLLWKLHAKLRAITIVRLDMQDISKEDRDLLSSGRTGEMFKGILSHNKTDLLEFLDNVKAILNRQIRPDGCLFSSKKHNEAIKQKINAIDLLQRYLRLSGFRIDDAKKELKEFHYAQYQVLEENKKQFLIPLAKMEARIPGFLIGTKIVGESIHIADDIEDAHAEISQRHSALFSDEIQQPLLSGSR